MMSSISSKGQRLIKAVYLLLCIVDLALLRLPWWTLTNLRTSWRPRSSWPLSKALRVSALRYLNKLGIGALQDSPDAKALRAGPGVLGVYVDGAPQYMNEVLKGWAQRANVEPTRIPGYWFHRNSTNFPMGERPLVGEKTFLFFHGGGYVGLSAHPDDMTATIPKGLLEYCASGSMNGVRRAFSAEFRLSSHDPQPRENPFPAALLDALAGYVYLVNDVGFAPKDIIVVGDSAGANLALALVRYVVEHLSAESVDGLTLEKPGAMILLSPWGDMGPSHAKHPQSSEFTNAKSDFLEPPGKVEGNLDGYSRRAFTGPNDPDLVETFVYASPASLRIPDEQVSFKDFPSAFIACGDAEMFVDQIRTLERRMRGGLGQKLLYYEATDAIHDYTVFDWHEPQRSATMQAIVLWLAGLES